MAASGRGLIAEELRRSAAHVLVTDVADPVLDDPTVHHLRRVLRLRDGEPITMTDGAGAWRCGSFVNGRVEPDGDVVVGTGARSGAHAGGRPAEGRARRVAGAEVHGGRCRPDRAGSRAERSVVRWDGERAERHLTRLRRIATEAALQSRRVWLPAIDGPRPRRRRAGGSRDRRAGRTTGRGRRHDDRDRPRGRVVGGGVEAGGEPRVARPERPAGRDRRARRGGADGGPTMTARPVRGVRAHPVLHHALRLLRLRHVDRPPAPDRRVPRRRAHRHRARRGRRDGAGDRACSSAAGRRRSYRPTGSPAVLRAIPLAPGAEVTVECNPDDVTEALFETYVGAGVTRVSIGVQSMVPPRARRARPHPRPGQRPPGRRRGPVGGAGDVQPRRDLRRRRRDARRLAHDARGHPRARPAPRLGVRADRRGRHAARRRSRPASGRRRPGRRVRARRRAARRRRPGQLRGVELGPAGPRVPAQPAVLGASTTTSASAAPPTRTAPAGGGGTCARRSATSTRCAPAGPTEAAGETLDAEVRRIEGLQLALRTTDGVPLEALDGDALPGLVERTGDRWTLTRRGRLLANEVSVRLR